MHFRIVAPLSGFRVFRGQYSGWIQLTNAGRRLAFPMSTEAATRADFSRIRYAQVWEDADVLLAALDVQPTDTVVSIASAGDNALALLGAGAARVVALTSIRHSSRASRCGWPRIENSRTRNCSN